MSPPHIAMASSAAASSESGSGCGLADITTLPVDLTSKCSHFVLMESTGHKRRFPAPWRVENVRGDVYLVRDANGVLLASVNHRADLRSWSFGQEHLTADEARRIAKAIARIPELMIRAPGFYSRGGGDKRWKESRPYHVALQDHYVRENWDWINALCAYNGIPFDPTGERINREGHWCVYEFSRQVDAIMFWSKFGGRWMRHNDFFYPDRPDELPIMKEPKSLDKYLPKNRR
jgi:hypothetical protein